MRRAQAANGVFRHIIVPTHYRRSYRLRDSGQPHPAVTSTPVALPLDNVLAHPTSHIMSFAWKASGITYLSLVPFVQLPLLIQSCSYNRYLAIAARVVRRSLKEDKRLVAERRGEMDLRFAKWTASLTRFNIESLTVANVLGRVASRARTRTWRRLTRRPRCRKRSSRVTTDGRSGGVEGCGGLCVLCGRRWRGGVDISDDAASEILVVFHDSFPKLDHVHIDS